MARKLAMMKRFNKQQEDFSEKHDPEEEQENEQVQGGTCMLCQSNMASSDDLMGVMAHFQMDNLSEYYYFSQTQKSQPRQFSYSLYSCHHHLHNSCA